MSNKELNINPEGLTKEEALEYTNSMIENAYGDSVKKYKVVDKSYSIRDFIIFLHDTCDNTEITELKSSYGSLKCDIKIGSKYVTREDIIDILSKVLSIDKKYLSHRPKIVVFNNVPHMYNLGRVLSIFEYANCDTKAFVINAEKINTILGMEKYYTQIFIQETYYTLESLKETIKKYLEIVADIDVFINSAAIKYYMHRVRELSFELISGDYLESIKLNYEPAKYDTSSLINNLVEIIQGYETEFNPMGYYNEFMVNRKYVQLSDNMTIMDIIKKIYDNDPVDCVRQFYSNGVDIVDILERLSNE